MYIYLNGKIIDESAFSISMRSQGFLYGCGLFETIKVLNGKPCFFYDHIERLEVSAKMLGMKPGIDRTALYKAACEVIGANEVKTGKLRISCYKGTVVCELLMEASQGGYVEAQYEKGFTLCLSNIRRNQMSPLTALKSFNYMENILARNEALEKGFDEAVFLNNNDLLCEGSISNLFWAKSGRIYTPADSCGLLPGITRKYVLKLCQKLGLESCQGEYGLAALYEAEEVFITNSLMDIMPVSCVENKNYDIRAYELTALLMEKYKELLTSFEDTAMVIS